MKTLGLLPLLLLAGCSSEPLVTTAMKGAATAIAYKEAFSQDSVQMQISLGSASFLQRAGRWPRTKEEIAEGLAAANLPANRLAEVQELTLREEDGFLLADFVSVGVLKVSGSVRISPLTEKKADPSGTDNSGAAPRRV